MDMLKALVTAVHPTNWPSPLFPFGIALQAQFGWTKFRGFNTPNPLKKGEPDTDSNFL
jgi:hypothetical protein